MYLTMFCHFRFVSSSYHTENSFPFHQTTTTCHPCRSPNLIDINPPQTPYSVLPFDNRTDLDATRQVNNAAGRRVDKHLDGDRLR